MKKFFRKTLYLFTAATLLILFFNLSGCAEDDNSLAPYAGSPLMSGITIEEANFKPKINWLGGFASVVAVNKGDMAGLNSSLVWLIHTDGNNIRYPVTFGELPPGAQDLTVQFGGTKVDILSEDETYTFWVMKEDLWNELSSHSNKYIKLDSTISTSSFTVSGDTINVGAASHTQNTRNLDVYINIAGVTSFGRLGTISIEVNNSNRPTVSWVITEDGSPDSLISAIGLVEGQQYNALYMLWDMYSLTDSAGVKLYGRENIIPGNIQIGDSVTGTITFVEFELESLERGKSYYIWIANNRWDRVNRTRFATGYAFISFNVR